ncbi:MAG: DUF1570 domain-containing protein [Pirellulaceae bacterium]
MLCLGAADAYAQSGGAAGIPRGLADGKRDVLHMKNGKPYSGVILARSDEEISFVHIALPPGKPMHLVLISFDAQAVESIELLSPAERLELRRQIQPQLTSKSMSVIEAGRMEDIALSEEEHHGRRRFVYEQPWFTLHSTADEESTRRCAVRIEQILRAFRQVLPPRVEARRTLRVMLLGSMDEYRDHNRVLGLPIENPAYYSPEENLIVAGSDLVRYSQRLSAIRRVNERIKEDYLQADRESTRRINEALESLREAGFSRQQIEEERRARKAAWEREFKAMVGRGDSGEIGRINRENEALFQKLTEQMFRRIYHEAFHAYLENHVFPSSEHHVPRWLNEGLAQVFENGQLDADLLRIDAPDQQVLSALREDLAGPRPLPLYQILAADDRAFLVSHGDAQASRRYYAYSWGLAWHLTFERNLLDGRKLDDYVSTDQAKLLPIERFENLVGMPIEDFDALWREAIFNPRISSP